MSAVRVKLCGITTVADARAAVAAGADLIGMILVPDTPRTVSEATARAIVAAVRAEADAHVKLVGVFMDRTPNEIAQTLMACNLDFAQLHGREPVIVLTHLGGRAYKVLKPHSVTEAEAEAEWFGDFGTYEHDGPDLLIDAASPTGLGGTGQRAHWDAAAAVATRYRILLAGGLRPESVTDAVAAVHPWGVDVSSGIEERPGKKDPARMRAFVSAVRAA